MNADVTPEELKAWREACGKATKGPWKVSDRVENEHTGESSLIETTAAIRYQDVVSTIWCDGLHLGCKEDDAEFIVLARTAMPKLLDALEAVMAERDWLAARVKELEETLGKIAAWDCLSPEPSTHVLSDLAWLKKLVDDTREGRLGRLRTATEANLEGLSDER